MNLTYYQINKKIIGRIAVYGAPGISEDDHENIQGVIEDVKIYASSVEIKFRQDKRISISVNRPFELKLYPKLPVNFTQFCSQLNRFFKSIDREPVDEQDVLITHFHSYRSCQSGIRLQWIQKHGYDKVNAWAEWFFNGRKAIKRDPINFQTPTV